MQQYYNFRIVFIVKNTSMKSKSSFLLQYFASKFYIFNSFSNSYYLIITEMEKACLLFLVCSHTICSTVNYILNGGFQHPVVTPANHITNHVCPTNWTCDNIQILGPQVTPLILYGQFLDMEDYGVGNLSQVIQLPYSGTCNLEYRQSFFADWPGYHCLLQIWWNGVLMATKPKATVLENLQRIVVRGVQGPNVLLLKEIGNWDSGGSLIDNFSLVCTFDEKPVNATEEIQQYVLPTAGMQSFSFVLSAPVGTLPSASYLYLFLSDFWLYNYDIRNYTGVMGEIFATATFIDNTKLEILSIWVNFSSYKKSIHLQKYMEFTQQKFIENEGCSSTLLDSNFQFFIFVGPQTILSSLLFYFLFLMLKNYKISLFLRPYYFVKTSIIQSLLEQNISYFVYVCFSHLQIPFFFWFYDKLSLFLTVLFLFCVLLFSLCFYYMLSKYLKKHSTYFHVKITKRFAGYSLLTFKNLVRPFLRGSAYFFLRYFYHIEMLTLSFIEVIILLLSLTINQNYNIYQRKTHFCLQILYHFLHCVLNLIFFFEYVLEGQNPKGKQQMFSFALQAELIIIYLLIFLTLSNMLCDIVPFKSNSKKGNKRNEKVTKKILIKKEDVNIQIQESGNLLKTVSHHFFQQEDKKQLKLKVKESSIFGQLKVEAIGNMELFSK